MLLEEIYQKSINIENKFKNKNILFIGSESYDAPTITILQGLAELGFDVCTIKKPNINSWFCNKIIDNPRKYKFDFVLSNLHWGTRWSYYDKYNLQNYLKILIDGDDNHAWLNWKEKFSRYQKKYKNIPDEATKDKILSPYRWVESMKNYLPDIVFTSQKKFDDKTIYLPFGIQKEYLELSKNKNTNDRKIDFANIDGPGPKRKRVKRFIKIASFLKIIPGKVFNSSTRGKITCNRQIKEHLDLDKDKNIHSYHRWGLDEEYFRLLNNTKTLIYPGILDTPQWDSKRPWEAYACGCFMLMSKPNINDNEYPISDICKFSIYNNYEELVKKCRYLYKNPDQLDKYRISSTANAKKFFTPKPLANYFLQKIYENLS